MTLRQMWQRHLRWAASTRRSRPRGHFGTGLIFAVPYGILCLIGGLLLHMPALGAALFAWSVANSIIEALVIGWGVTRCRDCLRQPWLYPLRDLMGFAVWATGYTSRNLRWRDGRFELIEGGKIRVRDRDGKLVQMNDS
jgi:ceramide glucosyltransferase